MSGLSCARFLAFVLLGFAPLSCGDGAQSDLSVCEGVTCSKHGVCALVSDTEAVCICDESYQENGLACEPRISACADVDCAGYGECVDVAGRAICLCGAGYTFDGTSCVAGPNPCADVDCSADGVCVVTADGAPACLCQDGTWFDGQTCTADANPCEGVTCSGLGACVITAEGDPVCWCEPGATAVGLDCEVEQDACAGVTCSHHGDCLVSSAGQAVCLCEPGFAASGLDCVPQTSVCDSLAACSEHGDCVVSGTGQAICLCDEGYVAMGTECVAQDDPCEGVSCSDHGDCVITGAGQGICVCHEGYGASSLACVARVNPCAAVTCSDRGFCIAQADGSPACLCDHGVVSYDLTCPVEDDPCADVTCSDQGVCVSAAGKAVCACEDGLVSHEGQCVVAGAVDVCEGVTCSDQGACVASATGPVCLCDQGFHWQGAECLPNVDPCADEPCMNGTCLISEAGPYCLCDPGFTSSGAACVPIEDPCALIDCAGHGTCAEVGGAPVCLCAAGYHAQGTTCVADEDPCEGVLCGGHGACVAASSGAACLCDFGYYAAGLTCLATPESVIPEATLSDTSNTDVDPQRGLSCIRNEVMLGVVEGHAFSDMVAAVAALGGSIASYDPDLRLYLLRFDPGIDAVDLSSLIDQLSALDEVSFASRNHLMEAGALPSDGAGWGSGDWTPGAPAGDNWYLEDIRAPEAWGYTTGEGGEPVVVGVIDLDFSEHEDLLPNLRGRRYLPDEQRLALEDDEHGTATTGLIAARGDNGEHQAGVLWRAEVDFCQTDDTESRQATCIKWLLDRGARVVSMSQALWWRNNSCDGPWTTPDGQEPSMSNLDEDDWTWVHARRGYWTQLLRPYLYRKWLFIQSAGNEAMSDARFAATSLMVEDVDVAERIIVVGAADHERALACYSNQGPIHIVAPGGEGACCTWWGPSQMQVLHGVSGQSEAAGTSFAAPLVSGAVALAWYANPGLSVAAMRAALLDAPFTVEGKPFLDVSDLVEEAVAACEAGEQAFDPQSGQCCTPDCDGRNCGPNGCGGDCGPCDAPAVCTAQGQCVVSEDPLPIGEIVSPIDGDTVSGTFTIEAHASDDASLVKLTLIVANEQGVQVFKDSMYPGQAEVSFVSDPVNLDSWGGGDYAIALWGLDSGNPAQVLDVVSVTYTPSVCVPDCGGKECGPDGCGDVCDVCGAGESCNWAGLCVESGLTEGFVHVPAGSFWMGSPRGQGQECPAGYKGGGCSGDGTGETVAELGRYTDEALHFVTLTTSFELQATEVTQGQWKAMTGGWNPSSYSSCGDDCPVENVSWFDAAWYTNVLSEAAGLTPCYEFWNATCENSELVLDPLDCMTEEAGGIELATVLPHDTMTSYECTGYRLPTEAEWEYAYRAGSSTPFYLTPGYDGSIIEDQCDLDPNAARIAWYCYDAAGKTHPVAYKVANTLGTFDMAGNVYEWCWDWNADYPGGSEEYPVLDPSGPASGSFRVYRGGSWGDYAGGCRAADRRNNAPGFRYLYLGFRPARSIH
jgi:formylglycine-generating enzyme required for sulfatase activity/subtilisin family serine protease